MRILHLSSLYPPEQVGGAELMVETLARSQAGLGHAVAVACASRQAEAPRPAGRRHGLSERATGRRSTSSTGRSAGASTASATSSRRSGTGPRSPGWRTAVRDFAPDLVNTHSISELSPGVWPMLRRLGVPVVHTLHDFTSLCTNGAMARHGEACAGQHLKCRVYAEPHRHCQRAVTAVAAVGTDILDRHVDAGFFGTVPAALRRVIWNPITPGAAAEPTAARRPARR